MDNQKGLIDRLDNVIEKVNTSFTFVGAFLMVLMVLIISLNIFTRFVFNYSFAWSIEVSEYILLYVSFLIAPWLLRHNEHINVELVYNAVPPKVKIIFNLISYLLGLLVALLLTVFGFTVTLDAYVRDVTLYNSLTMPKFILLIIIPVSGLLMVFEFIRKLLKELQPKSFN